MRTLLIMFFCAGAVFSQDTPRPKNELMLWGGFSPDSTTAFRAIGRTADARFGLAALRYSRRLYERSSHSLKYTADLVPAALAKTRQPDGSTKLSYALGASPLGLQMNFRPSKRLQPYADISVGFLYANRSIPAESGKRFNFTASVGGGVEYRLRDASAVSFGYKYFHISNGGRGLINPGIDNNLFYVGYTFFNK